MNDENSQTYAIAGMSATSYLELDLGGGGKQTDRVRVVNKADVIPYNPTYTTSVMQRLNGETLMAMDEGRNVLFHYTFNNIVASSPFIFDFDTKGNLMPFV